MARSVEKRALPVRSLRHGLSAEVLNDRACAESIDAAFCVHEALGVLHSQETYARAFGVELAERELRVHQKATLSVVYKKRVVGNFVADLLVEDRVLIKVVAEPFLSAEAKSDTVRGLSAGGVKVGLVFNFGVPELFFARIL